MYLYLSLCKIDVKAIRKVLADFVVLYVTDDVTLLQALCEVRFRQIEGKGGTFSHK